MHLKYKVITNKKRQIFDDFFIIFCFIIDILNDTDKRNINDEK